VSKKRKDAGNAVFLMGFGLLIMFAAIAVGGQPFMYIFGFFFLFAGWVAWKNL